MASTVVGGFSREDRRMLYRMGLVQLGKWVEADAEAVKEKAKEKRADKAVEAKKRHTAWANRKVRLSTHPPARVCVCVRAVAGACNVCMRAQPGQLPPGLVLTRAWATATTTPATTATTTPASVPPGLAPCAHPDAQGGSQRQEDAQVEAASIRLYGRQEEAGAAQAHAVCAQLGGDAG